MATISPVEVAAAASAGGFPDSELVRAVAVAYAESSWNTTASNPCCYGLWQINKSAHPDLWNKWGVNDGWKHPVNNAHMAYEIWRRAGGQWCAHGSPPNGCNPWQSYGNNNYKGALGPAQTAVQQMRNVLKANNVTTDALRSGAVSSDRLSAMFKSLTGLIGAEQTGGIPNPWTPIHKILTFVLDKHNWMRLGVAAGGIAMLLLGLAPLFTNASSKALRTIVNVTPQGRAAKLIGAAI